MDGQCFIQLMCMFFSIIITACTKNLCIPHSAMYSSIHWTVTLWCFDLFTDFACLSAFSLLLLFYFIFLILFLQHTLLSTHQVLS